MSCRSLKLKLSFDDIVLKSSLYTELNPDSKEEIEYEINADLKEVTTKQKFMHSDCMINLDGSYFLYNSDIDYGSKSLNDDYDDDFVYYFREFGALQEKTIKQLKGKFDFVDKKGNKLTAPDGFEFHVEVEENENESIGVLVGLKAVSDKEFTDEITDIAHSTYLKYTDNSGHSTIFFGK